jgi:hypothetical protein
MVLDERLALAIQADDRDLSGAALHRRVFAEAFTRNG